MENKIDHNRRIELIEDEIDAHSDARLEITIASVLNSEISVSKKNYIYDNVIKHLENEETKQALRDFSKKLDELAVYKNKTVNEKETNLTLGKIEDIINENKSYSQEPASKDSVLKLSMPVNDNNRAA